MFRGGQVESRGTGITSGLDDGYATGGRVAAADGGFFSNLLSGLFNPPGGTLPTPSYTGSLPKTGPAGLLQSIESASSYVPSLSTLLDAGIMATPSALAIAPFYGLSQAKPLTGKEAELQSSIDKINEAYYGQPRRQLMADVMAGRKTEAESPYKNFDYKASEEKVKEAEKKYEEPEKKDDTTPLPIEDFIFDRKDKGQKNVSDLTSDDIESYAKKYTQLLGGDKADRQAIFDAMLAASPGFFKGRTLTEAAPHVLEGIIKSGAFDKPQKIRQTAAELAIQRQLMLEKIKETGAERAKLAGVNIAGKQNFGRDLDILTKKYPDATWKGSIEKPWNQITDADIQSLPENSLFTSVDPKDPSKQLYARVYSVLDSKTGKKRKTFGFVGAPGSVSPSEASSLGSILAANSREE
jgi:hypothetical protein